MTIIVTDTGFSVDDWEGQNRPQTLDISIDHALADLTAILNRIKAIRITFPDFTDGRGLGLARGLRDAGYTGRLRATGDILPDQYAMLRRVGFDEVELTDKQANAYPQERWLARSHWRQHDYQTRLRC